MPQSNVAFQIEKQAYWQMRAELLRRHPHHWVAIADGTVVAVGCSADEVAETA